MGDSFMGVYKNSVNSFLEDLKNDAPIHIHYKKKIVGKNDEVIKILDYIKKRFNERFE